MQHMPAAFEIYWEVCKEKYTNLEELVDASGATLDSIMRWLGAESYVIVRPHSHPQQQPTPSTPLGGALGEALGFPEKTNLQVTL